MPRITDVGVMAQLLPASAPKSRGSARRRSRLLQKRHDRHAGPGAGRPAARIGPADGAAPRAHSAKCVSRLRAATSRRAAASARTCRRSSRSARATLDESGYNLDAPEGLKAASFYLDEASVTGTETALLAAAAAKGVSEIRHAATEPHVVELCEFLQAMGVGIEGAGTSTIRVHGTAPHGRRKGATHRLSGDYIEAGSWAVLAAVTRGIDRDPRRALRSISSR